MHKTHQWLLGVQLGDRPAQLAEAIYDLVEHVAYEHFRKQLIASGLKYLGNHRSPKYRRLQVTLLLTLVRTARPCSQRRQPRAWFRGLLAN